VWRKRPSPVPGWTTRDEVLRYTCVLADELAAAGPVALKLAIARSMTYRYWLTTLDGAQTGLERFAKPWYRPRALRVRQQGDQLSAQREVQLSLDTGTNRTRNYQPSSYYCSTLLGRYA
jgi:hypothetical protein